MSAHTPGPWRRAESYRPESRDYGTSPASPYVVDATGRNVAAAMIGGFDDPAEVDTNARLIAAAPDLLEALKSLMNNDGSSARLPAYDTRCVLAVEAIAKAEGR